MSMRNKLCLALCLAQIFPVDGYCFVSHSEDVRSPTNVLLVPCPSKFPSLPPTPGPTPACHDVGKFVTKAAIGRAAAKRITCKSLGKSKQARRDRICGFGVLFEDMTRPVKFWCPQACGYDCGETSSPAPSPPPSHPPTYSPSFSPSDSLSSAPSNSRSSAPSTSPVRSPTSSPSNNPSSAPSKSLSPSKMPSLVPTGSPSSTPSDGPSSLPSFSPTHLPSNALTYSPSNEPSTIPSNRPTFRCNVEPQVRSDGISDYIASKISNVTTLEDESSPESAALNWLIADDGRYLCAGDDRLMQRYVSALFYFAAGGPAWIKAEGFLSGDDECKWSGIDCNSSGNIEELNLDDNNLKGTLPPELYHLEDLTTLNFDGTKNSLSGTLPNTFGNLLNLRTIDLDKNNLEGTLPARIFALQKLEVLDIDSNFFSGTLSAAIGNSTNLKSIQLHNNRFTGKIPLEVRNLVDLSTFTIYDNEFTGSIQDDICDLEIDSLVADCAGQPPKIACDCCIKCFPDF